MKILINHQDLKTNQTLRSRFPAPLPGSVNDNVPVSANVHLYADPDSYHSDTPMLYADCEGLEGGEGVPRAEAYRMQDGAGMPYAQRKDSDFKARKRPYRKGTAFQGISNGLMVIKKSPSENMPLQSSTQSFFTLFQMSLYLFYATPSTLIPTLHLYNTFFV